MVGPCSTLLFQPFPSPTCPILVPCTFFRFHSFVDVHSSCFSHKYFYVLAPPWNRSSLRYVTAGTARFAIGAATALSFPCVLLYFHSVFVYSPLPGPNTRTVLDVVCACVWITSSSDLVRQRGAGGCRGEDNRKGGAHLLRRRKGVCVCACVCR